MIASTIHRHSVRKLKNMTKKYLTFDCYGTLINTEPLYQWVANLGLAIGFRPTNGSQSLRDL